MPALNYNGRIMKTLILSLAITLAAGAALADEHHGKSCDMDHGGKKVALRGTVACNDKGADCTIAVADQKVTYKVCEKSSAKVASAAGSVVGVEGKLVACADNNGETVIVVDKITRQ
jgi:hypothetical protein